VHVVKIACERPELRGRSLSTWDCQEIAKELVRTSVVRSISATSVRRILEHHRLKPWRTHMWLNTNAPRDAAFLEQVRVICDLYTRALPVGEVVLSVDEKTSIQARPRESATKPAAPGLPARVEHEYSRDGALNLIAAFDTRTGKVIGRCYDRRRQIEFIDLLETLNREIPASVHTIHVVLDNARSHTGKLVRAWLAAHPRFRFYFTPVHCSWMNQIEQWFSILQRKRLRIVDFASKADLRAKLLAFIEQHNEDAHPFNWSSKSVAKVMAWAEKRVALATAA
jgi:transposase